MKITLGLDKLVEVVASGVGAVAGPLLAPWKSQMEGRAGIVAAKADAKILQIRVEAHVQAREIITANGSIASGQVELSDHVNERIRYQEQKRLANIGSVVGKAAEELENKEVLDTDPDHDWTARFFNDVQDVSSEEMQVLWSKVLVGEIERPGSTSARTLGLLRNMDQPTAQLFAKFCSACIFLLPQAGRDMVDARVSSLNGQAASNSLQAFGFNYAALNRLNEHGLILSDYDSWHNGIRLCILPREREHPPFPFHHQDRQWILVPDSGGGWDGEFKISGPALSLAGRELSLVVKQEPLPEFTKQLQEFFLTLKLRMLKLKS